MSMGARFPTIVLWVAGLFFLVPGIWAFVAPHSFYDQLAPFPPYNRHLLHDIGVFQIGIGASLLVALRWRDGAFVALAGAGVAAIMHVISHVIDRDLGGKDTDLPLFALIAALIVVGAAGRWRMLPAAN